MKNHLQDNSIENNEHRLVTITNGTYQAIAHMPETFTIGVGSDISAPFSGFSSNGVVAAGAAIAGNVSSKIGLATRKTYMGPNQPDLSLDLKFDAYYSAFDEVITPTANLLMMATGSAESVEGELRRQGVDVNLGTEDFIKFLRTPGTCTVEIGNVITLDDVYLSDVNITYSAVLDSEGFPMEAEASVTLVPQSPITKQRVVSAFNNRI